MSLHRTPADERQLDIQEVIAWRVVFAGKRLRDDAPRLGAQLARVLELMSDRQWRTLARIRAEAEVPEASASARLRDLRNKLHLIVSRRRVKDCKAVWEYQVSGRDERKELAP